MYLNKLDKHKIFLYTNTMNDNKKDNIIYKEQFLALRKEQIKKSWTQGDITDRALVDWLLIQGNDKDIEWLMQQFPDPADTFKD